MSRPLTSTGPYDLVFGAGGIDDRLFPPIADEAAARDVPLHDPERFLFLGSVGRLVEAIGGEADADGGAGGERLRQHGRLIFHAFHFWREGKHELALDRDRLRSLLDDASPARDWTFAAPAPAGYIRLPRNLVWATADPGLQPEPAHGFFWTCFDDPSAGGSTPTSVHLLMALGVRPDRPGFSIVTASGRADEPGGWVDVDARPGAEDFATTLPGGELDRLYSVETPLELLKLASRCFRALDRPRG